MDISQRLAEWFTSEKSEVEPSLLAHVLLCKNIECWGAVSIISHCFIRHVDSTKNLTGLVDVLKCLASFWDEGDAACRTKCKLHMTMICYGDD